MYICLGNTKGTFDIKLFSIYSNINLYEKGTFHHKKDTFGPFKKFKWWYVHTPHPPPIDLKPLKRVHIMFWNSI